MTSRLARLAGRAVMLLVLVRSVALLLPAPAGAPARTLEPAPTRGRTRRPSAAPRTGSPAAPAPLGAPLHPGSPAAAALAVVALALTAALATVLAPQPVKGIVVFAAMLTVPGAAVTLRVRATDPASALGLTVAISLAIGMFASLAMVWTGFWHPVDGAALVGTASVLTILPLCRGRLRNPWRAWRPRPAALAALPVALALVLWATSLRPGADLVHVTALGLPVGLGPAWYLALAIAVTGAVASICRPAPNGWVIAAFIAVAAVIMYATLPALDPVPQNPWVYKHIGVTNLILQTGTVHPNVDLFNRWPGFFALAAVFSRVSGQPDAIAYAAWSDPVFALLSALLVAALARALTGTTRAAGWAALLYVVSNFVDQDYFSPQAVAFVLSLAIFLLIVRQLTLPSRIRGWISRVARVGGREEPDAIVPLRLGYRQTLALILVLQTALVITHELTPYIGLLELGGLAVLGVVRPRWQLMGAMAAIALGYLLANAAYVLAHYHLFTGFDPLANARVHVQGSGLPWDVSHGGGVISILTDVLALAAAVRLIWVGRGRAAIVLGVLAVMPYGLLFGQGYYGETSLRIFLFSAPWRVALIAWALTTIRRPWQQAAVGLAVAGALTALWLPAVLGNAAIRFVPAGEVAASRAFYDRAPAGSLLMLAAPAFPSRSGARYAQMAPTSYDANLTMYPSLRGRMLGARDIPRVIAIMRRYSRSDFLVFFSTADHYATTSGLLPAGSLTSLERAVRRSRRFRLWFRAPDARIYRVVR